MNRIENYVRQVSEDGDDLSDHVGTSATRIPTLTLGAAAAAFAGGAAIACALAGAYADGEG